jgi:hypothetical protein
MSSIDATLSERGQRYGEFEDHAEHSIAIKAVLFTLMGEEKAHTLKADQVEAICMIAHKLARITNGDPHYDDSWRDVAGYAQLVANRLARDAAKPEPEPKAEPKPKPEPEPKAEPKPEVEVKVRTFMADGDEVDMPPEIRNLLRRFLDPQ